MTAEGQSYKSSDMLIMVQTPYKQHGAQIFEKTTQFVSKL